MALTHNIVETRLQYGKYLTLIDITDTVTGQIYNKRPRFKTNPSQAMIDAQVVIEKERIQLELDYISNDMNLMRDEELAIEYLRDIKRDIVVSIRATPGVTLAQAQTYVDTNYPDSVIKFDKLYQFYLNLLDLSTWDEFKLWVINHKFKEID